MVPGRWQPSGGEGSGSGSCSAWLNSTRSDTTGAVASGLQQQLGMQQQQQQHVPATSQLQSQQQQALNALSGLNQEQLTIVHQKLQNNLQNYKQSNEQQLNMMLQSCAKKKIEELAMMHPFQMDANSLQAKPKCPECGKIYSNNSNLKQHIVNVHTVQTEYISCHVCNKQFKTKQYLQIHLLSMHGIRKRKSYPVYQMPTHAQVGGMPQQQQQQQQQFANQSPYPSPDRWTSPPVAAATTSSEQK